MSEETKKTQTGSENADTSGFFDEDPMKKYEKRDNKKTLSSKKKKVVGIVVGVCIIAALAAGTVIIVNTGFGKKEEKNSDTTEAATASADAITILDGHDASEVKTIDFTNSNGTFEIYRSKDKSGDDDAVFTLKNYEDYTQDNSIVGTLANNIVGLQTFETVDTNATDLDKYGLGDGAIKATVKLDDGTEVKFKIGNLTANSDYNYFCFDGEKTVYTVDAPSLNNFKYGVDDFISKDIIKSLDDDKDEEVRKVTVSRKDLNYEIKLDYDKELASKSSGKSAASSSTGVEPLHVKMTEPVDQSLNAQTAQSAVNGMFGLSADEFIKFAPSEDDLKKYGLDDPECTVEVKTSEKRKYKILIGNEFEEESETEETTEAEEDSTSSSGKYRYVYVDGGENIIYAIDESKLPWLTLKPIDITNKQLINSYVWDIGKLDVKTENGDSLSFIGSGSDKDDYKVTNNGKTCDNERYRTFYAFLIKAYGEDIVPDETSDGKKKMLTVTYQEQGADESHTLEFYDDGDLYSLIIVDGKSKFKCRKTFVEAVINNVKVFDTDEEFETGWK